MNQLYLVLRFHYNSFHCIMNNYRLFVLCILFFPTLLAAQEISLVNGKHSLAESLPFSLVTANEIWQGRVTRALATSHTLSSSEKVNLETQGVLFHGLLSRQVYLVSVPAQMPIGSLKSETVSGLFVIQPNWKLSPPLLTGQVQNHALLPNGDVDLVASVVPGLSIAPIIQSLRQMGFNATLDNETGGTIKLTASQQKLTLLAAHPALYYVETVAPPAEPENLPGKNSHRSNVIDRSGVAAVPLNGNGVVVALGDDGIIGPHADYQGRINQVNVTLNNGTHGDHIAGTIMGAGNIDPSTKGMAPASELMVYQVWNAVNQSPVSYVNNSVRITSTSYSDGCNTGYTSFARTADIHINNNSSLMHVFSAGNNGASNCNYGAGAGWGNITGGVKVAKNVIAVGNTTSLDVLNGSSSVGPVHDGRIKPDICAVGTDVFSTINPHTYNSSTGTSMAAPGISGVMAQLYQGYRLLNNNVDPPSSLIKAVMMNTADDIGNSGPDFKHGFGRVNARRAYNVIKNSQYLFGSISQGDTVLHTLQIPAGTDEIRVMVYWHDKEALANASKALVNNLDAVIVDPSGLEIQPWRLNHAPNANLLNSPAFRGRDTLNNQEQITVSIPSAGNHTIRIVGENIPFGPQNYVVVYEFRNSSIHLTYPRGGETFIPGFQYTIRWDAMAGSYGVTSLQYSVNNGQTWTSIIGAVIAAQRHHNWLVPFSLEGKRILIRVRRGSNGSDVTELPVSIMKTPDNLAIDWACTNGLKLKWTGVPFAKRYVVHQLGSMYMDSIGSTLGTEFVVNNISSFQEYFFAITALGDEGLISNRTIAVRKTPGTFGCIAPTAQMNAADSSCTQLNMLFTDVSQGAAVSYQWDFGTGANPSTAIGLGPHQVIYTSPGLKNVSLIVGNSLGIDTVGQTVTIQPNAEANFSFQPTALPRMIAFTSLANHYDSLLWEFGDGMSSTQLNPIHQYSGDSLYLAKLNVYGYCETRSITLPVDLSQPSGTVNKLTEANLLVYPNPASDRLIIESNSIVLEKIRLIDTQGKLHMEWIRKDSETPTSIQLNTSGLAGGMYLLSIESDQSTVVRKLRIE